MKRLGLDIGTNSIGWCLIEDDGAGHSRIVDIGVRIFGYAPSGAGREPKSGTSLAVERRNARAMRRRRDRYLGRRAAFLKALKHFGLMPSDESAAKQLADNDPYELRARALNEQLEPYEVGRALFHLNQRRGFRSNRKAERKSKDNEDGKIRQGEQALDRAMVEAGAETLGQFLHMRQQERDDLERPRSARVRLNSASQDYDFYPQRRHIEWEFHRIWDEQAKYHPEFLTLQAFVALHRILFFQRPLKEQPVGRCTFAGWGDVPTDDPRLPKWHPLFQERRLYEEVNHLRITAPGERERPLTLDQRDRLVRLLKVVKEPSFTTLAKEINLQPEEGFNKHTATRSTLPGNAIYAAMANKKIFGNAWPNMTSERQQQIIDRLLNEEDPATLHSFLANDCGLDERQIALAEKASREFPVGYGRLGLTATQAVIAELKRYLDENGQVITYDRAVDRGLKLHHSDRRTGEVIRRLPYYGELLTHDIAPAPLAQDEKERRWGKITNPTVHIGLRQLEKLINAIVAAHGLPDEIVVELARELKQNDKDKERENKRIRETTAAAQRRSKTLIECGQRDNGRNRMLLRLWEELAPDSFMNRHCPYCGRVISPTMLFNGEADVDHILPYSRTLDDSPANKVVACRSCNRLKERKTPWERWGDGRDPARWAEITAQVPHLHRSKQWRFAPDAMERFEKDRDFLDRQLVDTQYLSKLARRYLTSLYADRGEGSGHVYVVQGRMTAMLRRLWALEGRLGPDGFLNEDQGNDPVKNRNDHRHHAIDAFVVAVTTRSLLKAIAEAASRAEQNDLDRMFEGLPEPWPGYRGDLGRALACVTVSHKPDHGRKGMPAKDRDVTAGRLHNDTAYGLTGDVAADGKTPIVVHRIPLMSLKPADISDPDRIPDPELRAALHRATDGLSGKGYEAALASFAKTHPLFAGIRRVRVREPLNVIQIHDRNGKPYKAYKGDANARFELWRLPDGKLKSEVVSMFRAHQKANGDSRPHPAAKRLLLLRQNDMLAIERNGGPKQIVRVVGFNAAGRLTLAEANEGGNLKERDGAAQDLDPFKYIYLSGASIVKAKARQVRIDPLGRIFDPGPR